MFRMVYCMYNSACKKLLDKIKTEIETQNVEIEIGLSRLKICARERLAVAHRLLFGKTVWGVQSNFALSSSELHRTVHHVVGCKNPK